MSKQLLSILLYALMISHFFFQEKIPFVHLLSTTSVFSEKENKILKVKVLKFIEQLYMKFYNIY